MRKLKFQWMGKTRNMCSPGLSDHAVAARVRMLTRNQLNHEAVCCMARDRIMGLSALVEKLEIERAKNVERIG